MVKRRNLLRQLDGIIVLRVLRLDRDPRNARTLKRTIKKNRGHQGRKNGRIIKAVIWDREEKIEGEPGPINVAIATVGVVNSATKAGFRRHFKTQDPVSCLF